MFFHTRPRMKKHIPTLLATLIGAAISQQAFADDLMSQCMLGVPSYNRPLVNGDTNQMCDIKSSAKACWLMAAPISVASRVGICFFIRGIENSMKTGIMPTIGSGARVTVQLHPLH